VARYTLGAIAALAATQPDPAAFAAAVEANVVSREDNVRAALAKVELGEGDAAFVYVTDALGAEGVREVPLTGAAGVRAEYAAVQVSERPLAAEFVRWLSQPEAVAVIEAAGFETAS
jgi:molybdate transport system substrate-binding protein